MYDYNEILAEKIKDVLIKICPAFRWEGSQTAVWHGAKCLAKGENESCTCVWHISNTCIAGTWKELGFVYEKVEQKRQDAETWLKRAQKYTIKAKAG
jgi:hypothetical protein